MDGELLWRLARFSRGCRRSRVTYRRVGGGGASNSVLSEET